MSDRSLRPIFPPTQPFVGSEALAAGLSILDPETQGLLAVDSARLTQSTAAAGMMLGTVLGFEQATSTTLARQIVEVSSGLPPEYRAYLNQLLGAAASVLALIGDSENIPVEAAGARLHIAASAEASDAQVGQAINIGDDDTAEMDGPVVAAGSDVLAEGFEAGEQQVAFEPLDKEVKFISYNKTPQYLRRFLSKLFSDEIVKNLSPKESAVSAHLMLKQHMATPINRYPEHSKLKHHKRLERVFGLTEPVITVDQLANELGLGIATLHVGMANIREQLKEIFADSTKRDELLERAKLIAAHDEKAVFIDEKDWVEPASEIVEGTDGPTGGDGASGEGILPGEATEQAAQASADKAANERQLKKYDKSPVNMRNFAARVLPQGFEDRIKQLSPSSLSFLVQQYVEIYKTLEKPGCSEEKRDVRIKLIERWTGMYEEPLDFSDLATRRNVTPQQIEQQIESVVRAFSERVKPEVVKSCYDWATQHS